MMMTTRRTVIGACAAAAMLAGCGQETSRKAPGEAGHDGHVDSAAGEMVAEGGMAAVEAMDDETTEDGEMEIAGAPEDEAAQSSGPSLAVQLSGTRWSVVAIRGAPLDPNAGGRAPEIVFLDGTRASFTGGCNRFVGSYAYGWPEALSFGGDFAGTRMACPDPLMAQDNALADAARIIATDGGKAGGKAIVDADGGELVALVALPPEDAGLEQE
ncbi:MAG: META domain-containing protein [Alphaproteobacteria bacterium]|nr:META domain-containing protein [Alphaproteobacteria bacterium]